MNKKIIEALGEYDFQYEKNYGYGHIDGYEVNVYNNPIDKGPVFVFSTFLSLEDKKKFISILKAYSFKLVTIACFDYGVIVQIGVMTAGGFKKKLDRVLPKILQTLGSLHAPKANICPKTGKEIDATNSKLITIPEMNIKITLSNDGIDTINQEITNNDEEYNKAPNHYLRGLGGILIGAHAGALLTVIFSIIGIIAVLSPIVSIFLGSFLYRKFKGKPNYMMIVMSFVATAVFISFTLFYIYFSVANSYVADQGLSYSGMEAFKYCLENVANFKSSFKSDLFINGLFTIFAEIGSIAYLLKFVKRPKKIK